MPDLTRWVSGADFIKMGEFLAPEGRRLFEMGEFLAEEAIFRAICCYQLTAKITLLIRRAIFAVLYSFIFHCTFLLTWQGILRDASFEITEHKT